MGLQKDYQPYTYLIKFIPTGQLYYGARTAKGCHPSEFWIKYCTSSKIVKALIREQGKEAFEVIHTIPHETAKHSLEFEELVLREADGAKSNEWLNRCVGGTKFSMSGMTGEKHHNYGKSLTPDVRKKISEANTGKIPTAEARKKMSEAHSGEKNHNFGKTHPPETKKKISEAQIGKSLSPEHRAKIGEALRGKKNPNFGKSKSQETRKKLSEAHVGKTISQEHRKKLLEANLGKSRAPETKKKISEAQIGEKNTRAKSYLITYPDGRRELIVGLHDFCRKNGLSSGCMSGVLSCKYKQHKGFKCEYANPEPQAA